MSQASVARWRQLCAAGRYMDVLEEFEKVGLKLTQQGEGFRLDGPYGYSDADVQQLLQEHRNELSLVLRLSTLATDRFGNSRLHAQVGEGSLAEVERLLQNGARPNATNRFGQTPLHLAIARRSRPTIEALARAGADLGQADLDGSTPLHLAVDTGDETVLLFLLANGAPVNRSDFFGITPLARAVGRDHKKLASILLEYGGELEDPQLGVLERDFLQLVLRLLDGFPRPLYEHSLRVGDLARCLALTLELEPDQVIAARLGGLLHDLGKVSLPEDIFDQADEDLTQENVDLLLSHPEDGAAALNRHLTPARWPVHPVILHHHERWDGQGFPQGLSGADIPLLAQLVAVADFYDHLVTHRNYDPAVPQAEALARIQDEVGGAFGEEVVGALFEAHELLSFYSP